MKVSRNQSFCLVVILLATLVGCPPATPPPTGTEAISVVCTTGQLGDMLTEIGGELLDVTTLMGPGVDPHLYKATPGDSRALKQADLVFYNGLHLEGRLASLLESLAEQRPVHAVAESLGEPDNLRRLSDDAEVHDPHVWFDVALWIRGAEFVTETLAAHDPENAEVYRANGSAYVARLKTLDALCSKTISTIPEEQRILVTAHDAFGYFGVAYGIEVHGLQGISTSDEADLESINALVEMLVERKVKAVFIESSVPERNLRVLIEACDQAGHEVRVGGSLYSDALGPFDTPEASYIGVVEHNIHTIAEGLK